MKKIINGKVYDTNKATRVGVWENGFNYGDFGYCSEDLYQKRTGEFFLHGEGGAMSKYAVSEGNNSWAAGEKIIPVDAQTARKWAEDHLSGEEYEAIFGEIQEDETKKTITVSLQTDNIEKAKRAASERGINLSALIDELISKNL